MDREVNADTELKDLADGVGGEVLIGKRINNFNNRDYPASLRKMGRKGSIFNDRF